MTRMIHITNRDARFAGFSPAGRYAPLCVMDWPNAGGRDFAGERRIQGPDFRLS